MQELEPWLFDVYSLALPRGHGFRFRPPIAGWRSDDGHSWGVVTQDGRNGSLGVLVARRRVDGVWTVTCDQHGFAFNSDAIACLHKSLREREPPERVPSGTPARPALYDLQGRTPSDIFKLLGQRTHAPAAWLLNQVYLALPRPDANWAGDFQTHNFHTRMWEAQLLASFREQGLLVTQPFESPDFCIEHRRGGRAWVEAVTANPPTPYNHVNAQPSFGPEERLEKFFGPSALRFAKTLGNKLSRRYDLLPHVVGDPFVLAVADFQAPASMTWSRLGLVGYLYGEAADEAVVDGQPTIVPIAATHLLGASAFPAGLFADDRHAQLSAVVFSNACSLGKFNRVLVTRCDAPEGLRYTRIGEFFDRAPGARRGIPFCMDVSSPEYRSLWDVGVEPWCAELEVFHNPFARYPLSHDLLPDATHWFLEGGERVCRSVYKMSILHSWTCIQSTDQPPVRLEDVLQAGAAAPGVD